MSEPNPFDFTSNDTDRAAGEPAGIPQARAVTTIVACPRCAQTIAVPAGADGREGRCPACNARFVFPSAPSLPSTAPPAPQVKPPIPTVTLAEPPTDRNQPPPARRRNLVDDAMAAETIEQIRQQRRGIRQAATAVAVALASIAGGIVWTVAATNLPHPQGSVVGIGLAVVAGLVIGGVVRSLAELLLPSFPIDRARTAQRRPGRQDNRRQR